MLIVNFHNVISGSLDVFDRFAAPRIDINQFISAIDGLSQRFKLVSLPDLLSRLERGAVDDQVASLTFDDGHHGILRHAFPILRGRGIDASVMVVTQILDSAQALFHFEELEMAFRISTASTLEFPGFPVQSLETDADRVRCLVALKRELKLQPEVDRRKNHDEILRCLHVTREQITEESRNFPVFDKLNSNELRFLSSFGWTIGSHTRTHRTLSHLDEEEAIREVMGSRDDIRIHLGIDDMPFAYPYGGPQHIGNCVRELVETCGYSCALTTTPGGIPRGANPLWLPRTNIEDIDVRCPGAITRSENMKHSGQQGTLL